MRYRILGKSGLRVSEICLGTMTFGEDWGWGSNLEQARAVLDAYAEAGGNFIDTANMYTGGTSERFVGELVKGRRDRFVIATKYTNSTDFSDPNASGNHRKNMMAAVEKSLERLGVDTIDLLWLHAWDGMTPIEEVMRAFDDLVRQGKIHYVGLSDVPAWVAARADLIAELRAWSPVVALQLEYSLIQRTTEREHVPMARALDVGLTAWSPLGMGYLTGKYRGSDEAGARRLDVAPYLEMTAEREAILDVVLAAAEAIGCSAAQVAIAWVLEHGWIPIIGARRVEQLRENIAAADVEIPEAWMAKLNDASWTPRGFPADFLCSTDIKKVVLGKTYDQIDPHRPSTI